MRRAGTLALLLLPALLPAQGEQGCFTVLVGKAVSAGGGVLVAHNEDDTGDPVVYHWREESRVHPEGTTLRLKGGGAVAQAPRTHGGLWIQMPGYEYSDLYLNEHGLGLVSNACPSREDKPDLKQGGIGYMLRRLVAQRARTAREAVAVATGLVAEWGYAASGRTLVLADAEEAWLLCLVQGRRWLAARVPDDRICVLANAYPVHEPGPEGDEGWRHSPDLIEYARAKGWWDPGRDGPFAFARAYADPAVRINPANHRRQWRALCLLTGQELPEGWRQPLFAAPRGKVGPKELFAVLRDFYQGSPYDTTGGGAEAHPLASGQRTICCRATQSGSVLELRAGPPLAGAALLWLAPGRPDASLFLPWYLGSRGVPPGFALGAPLAGLELTLRGESHAGLPQAPHSALLCELREWLDRDYPGRREAVRKLQEELEGRWLRAQPELEAAARRLHDQDPELARELLTACTFGQTWRALEGIRALRRGAAAPAAAGEAR